MTNLSHRLPGVSDNLDLNLLDNLHGPLMRAQAIADLIRIFATAKEDPHPEMLLHAAHAVMLEIQDAQVLLDEWQETKWAIKQADKEDAKRDALREAMMTILEREYPDEVERAAEIERRMRERLPS